MVLDSVSASHALPFLICSDVVILAAAALAKSCVYSIIELCYPTRARLVTVHSVSSSSHTSVRVSMVGMAPGRTQADGEARERTAPLQLAHGPVCHCGRVQESLVPPQRVWRLARVSERVAQWVYAAAQCHAVERGGQHPALVAARVRRLARQARPKDTHTPCAPEERALGVCPGTLTSVGAAFLDCGACVVGLRGGCDCV